MSSVSRAREQGRKGVGAQGRKGARGGSGSAPPSLSDSAFKETEVGLIPEQWDVIALGQVAKLNLGRTPRRSEVEKYWTDGIIPWVTISDLNNGYVRHTKERVSRRAFEEVFKQRIVPQGALLLSFKLTIGKVGILEMDAVHNEAIISFELGQEAHRDFLFFLFQHIDYDAYLDTYLKGKTLSKSKLKVFPIPLPPLPEQRRIAGALRTIQEAIAVQEDVIAAARELKRSLMERLFTYGPTAEPAPTKETDFGTVPASWEIRLLDECAYIQTGAAKGRKLDEKETISVPYLRVANVQDGYLDLSEVKYIRIRESEVERYGLQPGDVVLTEGGDFDKLGRGFIWNNQIPNCIHQNHIFAVRVNREILLPTYLGYLVQSEYAKSYFLSVAHRTTNLACINKTKLAAFPTLIPSMEEQAEIAGHLQVVDSKIAAEEQRKIALEELFRSALEQLMTGQIRI